MLGYRLMEKVIFPLTVYIWWISMETGMGLFIQKSTTACNGPCGQLSGTCPSGHRLAIQDAIYRVQYKTSSCNPLPGCNNTKQEVCCETRPQDCVFPYGIPEMQNFQRNCSATPSCTLQTRYPDIKNTQCAPDGQQKFSSHTVMNYICINDSFVIDMCSPAEMVVKGNTLFAIADARASKNLAKNSVCACRAESGTQTDVIAAFVVDMRMNKVGGSECTDASLSIRSGNEYHNLDCSSSLDPKISYPFVAVVNVSNAVHLRLQVQSSLAEFVWIGFESNENKDIRLSCQLQNVELTKNAAVDPISNTKGARDKHEAVSGSRVDNNGILIPAVIGGAVAAVVLIILLIVIILMCKKKITCPGSTKPLGSEHDAPVDFDIYYSTTDDELKKLEAVQASSARSSLSSATDLYISPEDVRANKRRNSKRLSEISVRDLDDDGDEYVTQFEIQHRKKMSRKNKEEGDRVKPPNTDSMDITEYDRLDRKQRRPSDDVIDSYDRLGPGNISGSQLPETENVEGLMSSDRKKSKKGASNLAYEETELQCDSGRSTVVLRPVKSNPVTAWNTEGDVVPEIPPKLSSLSYPTYDVPRRCREEAGESDHSEATPLTRLSLDRGQSHTAGMVAVVEDVDIIDKTDSLRGKSKERKLLDDKSDADIDTASPVVAPRRKKKSLTQPYDIAKPIH